MRVRCGGESTLQVTQKANLSERVGKWSRYSSDPKKNALHGRFLPTRRVAAALFTDLVTALAIDPYELCHLGCGVSPPPLLTSPGSSVAPDPDH